MITGRLVAFAAPVAFTALAAALTLAGAVTLPEAVAVALSSLAAFAPPGWLGPGGWRRRAAELTLIPAGLALTLVADSTQRRMLLPLLLTLAALAALVAARRGAEARHAPILAAALATALVAAGGLGLAGVVWWRALLAVCAAPLVAGAVAAWLGLEAGALVALLAGPLPLARTPFGATAAVILGAALLGWRLVRPTDPGPRKAACAAWHLIPLAATLAATAMTLAPWQGLGPGLAFPAATGLAALGLVAVAAAALRVPPALAGVGALAAATLLGPLQPAPPDRGGPTLTAATPAADLPAGAGSTYLLDVALANAGGLPTGAEAATLAVGVQRYVVRVGHEVAEWAARRPGARVAHELPVRSVWRPHEVGASAFFAVGGRLELTVPVGVIPRLERAASLPAKVVIAVSQVGPSRATPPRDWRLPEWLWAAAGVVAVLHLLSRTWRHPGAFWPWVPLLLGSLAGRVAVEPLRLLAERHAVDLALAALLAAWALAARRWLSSGRPFVTAAALLVPLALATPHLANPMGDGSYHLLLTQSLAQDGDLDLANNYDLARHPNQKIYVPFTRTLIHSPALAVLLTPGYLVGGRGGALALLALAGAALVALVWRRAAALGVPPSRLAIVASALLLSYPVVTFACEMWTELPGALLLAVALVGAAARGRVRLLAPLAALASVAIKTRFGLALVPVAAAAFWRHGARRRGLLIASGALLLTGLLALGVAALLVGHPLDPLGRRSLSHLLRTSPPQAVKVVSGLAWDSAGGLLWSAPLALAALLGVAALARRGGPGERAALLGGALTVAALLHLVEWRGGDSPPARYLVPLLPVFALAGAMLLARARRWRPLLAVLVPPTLVVTWVAATRPFLLINSGNGGFWLANTLARRLEADALHLFPSLLRPSPSAWIVPLVLAGLASCLALAARYRPDVARLGRSLTAAVWLGAAAALVTTLAILPDRIVEVEDPQVRTSGGTAEPGPGAWSRFLLPNGWRLGDGNAVEVALRLPRNAVVAVSGWLDGAARDGAMLEVAWDGATPRTVALTGAQAVALSLPDVPPSGRHRMRLVLHCPSGGSAVLDRLQISRLPRP